MKNLSSLLLGSLFICLSSASFLLADPTISLNLLSSSTVCSSGRDTVQYSLTATGIPANTNIVVYQSTDSTFNPYSGQGDSIGFIPGNAIPKDTVNFGSCVKILGEFIDACGATGQEGKNEYIILTSGSGIRVSNLGIDFSSQNNGGATNADINLGANPCGYKTPTPSLIAGLRAGSCNASNVIPASPSDSIPPNAVILLFTSDSVSASYSINGLCNLGYPIYVLQSSCVRTIGAFTNASRCDAPSRYRTTLAVDKRQNCSDNFTYDLCGIFDKDGTFAIRQQGTDTASVANNGIRRNTIDSCGGIDYAQLNFAADTILKFSIPTAFCNTGFHYIKAVTHPNGTQPVSNTIRYQLVCNDVTAITTTTNICSGDSVKIGITSTDPNATFSWTVNGGNGISGAVAGTGNTIGQVLSYNGNTKDSVIYTVTSTDAGCAKSQQVKVIVNNCITICSPVIAGNRALCGQEDSLVLDAGAGFTAYSWSTGATTQTITVKNPGKYVVNVTGQNCTGKDSVNVIANSLPQVSISGNTVLCPESRVTLTANADADSVRWNTGESSSDITVSSAQEYTVTVFSNGCSNKASVNVTASNPPVAFSLGNDTSFCGAFSKVLSTGIASTQWNTQATGAQITVSQAGTYIATISNTCGTVSDTIVINRNEPLVFSLGNDTSFCNGVIELSSPAEMSAYLWNTGAQTASISVSEAGTYWVKITAETGCISADTIVIGSNCARDLWIPNAFTPNHDGMNDVFMVRGSSGTVIERFIIYNRWGNKVFEATDIQPNDPAKGWDGTFKGEPAPFEVYGYEVIARFNNGEKKTLKGNVTLLK